jgi:CO dehydrogenase maturation factor
MATTIAISGKGGSGKTTLSAMIIRLLCSQSQGAILAVDADPNACLGQMLGVKPEETIAEIREQTRQKQPSNEGTDRLRTLEYGLQQAITEATGFDLLTFLDKLSSQYQYVIIDNEAGMEHLSRRTTNNVDLLCIVAEPTAVGDLTARRIFELAKQLPISVKETGVIWNRTESSKTLDEIETFGNIPEDKTIFDASMQGKTIFDLEENSAALSAVRKILELKLNRNFQLNKNQN